MNISLYITHTGKLNLILSQITHINTMNNIDSIYLRNKMLSSKCLINNQKLSNKKIIISGTHNNRLECFFNKYLLKSKHFSNCAII